MAVSSLPYHRASLAEPPVLHNYAAFESPHQTLEWHQPADRWQLLIVPHSGVCSCDGRVFPYGPRAALVFPPRARCRLERTGRERYEHAFAYFTPYDSSEDQVALPLATDVTDVFTAWDLQRASAFDRLQFTRKAIQAWLWSVLWHLATGPENVRSSVYVEQAERIVSERLSTKICIADLADELEISHSQLVRLFRAEHGCTVQEYVRTQRAVVATRLLTGTTRPVKAIAAQVGVPDLQQFSRLIRYATGVSPRRLRDERKNPQVHTVVVPKPGVREDV